MPYSRAAFQARTPWPEGTSSGDDRGETASQQRIRYHCAREGCPHDRPRRPLLLPFAEDAEIPDAVWCRCGGVARHKGASPDSHPDDGTGNHRQIWPGMHYVRQRRSEKDLNDLLDEALRARWGTR